MHFWKRQEGGIGRSDSGNGAGKGIVSQGKRRTGGMSVQNSLPFITASDNPSTSVTYPPRVEMRLRDPAALGLSSLNLSQCFNETGRPSKERLSSFAWSRFLPSASRSFSVLTRTFSTLAGTETCPSVVGEKSSTCGAMEVFFVQLSSTFLGRKTLGLPLCHFDERLRMPIAFLRKSSTKGMEESMETV